MENITEAVEKTIKGANNDEEKAKSIFHFVRDTILFGFINSYYLADAEEVLKKRCGVCMNKTALLVAMANKAGIPARFHYSWVTPECLMDLIHPIHYKKLPDPFLHVFADVKLYDRWVPMDTIFDNRLHKALLKKKLNFARYPENRSLSNEFSSSGVIGGPMLFEVEDGGYSNDLSRLYETYPVKLSHRILKPFVFRLNNRIIRKVREA